MTGADGVPRRCVEADHERRLVTIFGEVRVARLAYRHKGTANLYPADAALNLPEEAYSHGLRAIAAIEAARGSFDEAVAAIERASAVTVAKAPGGGAGPGRRGRLRGVLRRTPGDPSRPTTEVVVLSADGKGVVMRPEALRAATRAKAEASASNKLKGRLSKGEKTQPQADGRGRRGLQRHPRRRAAPTT